MRPRKGTGWIRWTTCSPCSARRATSRPPDRRRALGGALRPADRGQFNAVRRGRCLLRVDSAPEPVPLDAGDCFLLTRPVNYTLASALDAGRTSRTDLPSGVRRGGLDRLRRRCPHRRRRVLLHRPLP
ncbi:cupin domain-containing protein [Micromonospora sp. BRA006-A]|nr:cupin domain-containing protein [Micromonospora sp. BRA006-A]